MIEYVKVTTNESGLAEQIGRQLKNGEDFFVVMEPISPSGIKIEKKPLSQLPPVIRDAVGTLASGQVTTIVEGSDSHFIKVVRSAEKQLLPLEKVQNMIEDLLKKQRFKELRASYVQRLRERSVIKENKGAWKALRKQLLEEELTNES